MKVIFYSIKNFERPFLEEANKGQHDLTMVEDPLTSGTVLLAKDFDVVSICETDDVTAAIIKGLQKVGIKYIAVRGAIYDSINISAAYEKGIKVSNVPRCSPYNSAEHAVLLMLALSRKLVQAVHQVQKKDFTLEGLISDELHNKKVGIVGTGRSGSVVAKILHGFGCTLLATDTVESQQLMYRYNVHYLDLPTLCSMADIITVHVPLTKSTNHLIAQKVIKRMKKEVMLINTSAGGVVHAGDVLTALESGSIGSFGMDVYEKEKGVFLHNYAVKELADPILEKLMTLPNVLITPHQTLANQQVQQQIAATTFYNINCWARKIDSPNELTYSGELEEIV